MALVDVDAKDADAAVAAAWAAYGGQTRKLKMSSARADREGWNDTRFYFYERWPNEQREVIASAGRSSGSNSSPSSASATIVSAASKPTSPPPAAQLHRGTNPGRRRSGQSGQRSPHTSA